MNFHKILVVLSALTITACGSTQKATQNAELPTNPTTQATLWVQNSAEYKALTTQAYGTAIRNLSLPLEDSFWTASVTQEETRSYMNLPPAIILDIDETVLDNSPFQARMIKQDKTYSIEDWNAWCNEANADAIPGAVDFTTYAAEQGIAIFYISNRAHEVEDATRKNLIEAGFPVSNSIDNIMTNGEKPGWNSSKIQRRQQVENNYRVLLIFGDDLNDFVPAKDISQADRAAIIDKYSLYFGRKWFMLPNPVYGSWESALFDFEDNLSDQEKNAILYNRLNAKQKN